MSISELTDHTGYWLRMVSNAVSQEFARKIAAEDVTVAEWALMRTLFDGEALLPSVLAEKMGLTKGAVSKLSDRLLAKGLISRLASKDDKRAHSLSLTEAGAAKVPVLAAIADRNDAEFFGALSHEEHGRFLQTLLTLASRSGGAAVPID